MAKIVVIDDARADLQLMESILRSADHQVVTIQDPVDVEARLAGEHPDAVLLDVVMPKRNGYEILRNLKKDQRTSDIPIVLVSSKSEPHDLAWGKRQGADGYVPKPFTEDQLLGVLGRILA